MSAKRKASIPKVRSVRLRDKRGQVKILEGCSQIVVCGVSQGEREPASNGPVVVGHQERFSSSDTDAIDEETYPMRNGEMTMGEAMQVGSDEAPGALWPYAHAGAQLKRGTPPGQIEQTSPLMLGDRSLLHDVSSVHDETSSSGNKDDDDEYDEESDDKVDLHKYDPERLKAFNMFVRLFVDENLDRIVPISKQPKEKIQAIIDSCTRQFPEFAERARKRIRTYLKSCRRNKRSRDGNGAWDTARPTPAHLTSVQAEQILAQACENESHNAKRMRLGLEPVSQPMPLIPGTVATESVPRPVMLEHFTAQTTVSSGLVSGVPTSGSPCTLPVSVNPIVAGANTLTNTGTSPNLVSVATGATVTSHNDWDRDHDVKPLVNNNHVIKNDASLNSFTSTPIKKEVVPSVEIIPTQMKAVTPVSTPVNCVSSNNSSSPVPAMNGSVPPAAPTTVYRPNFSQAFQRTGDLRTTAPPPQPVNNFQSPPFNNNDTAPVSNGPTDLSMKSNPTKPLLSHKLNSTEIIAVRQLITGYRESAAFLLRSADELEQLLLSQH